MALFACAGVANFTTNVVACLVAAAFWDSQPTYLNPHAVDDYLIFHAKVLNYLFLVLEYPRDPREHRVLALRTCAPLS